MVPLILQATGSCLETKLAYLRLESRSRYCFQVITSLVSSVGSPRKAKRGLKTTLYSEQSLDRYLFFVAITVGNNFPNGWWCHCHQRPPSRFLDVSRELGVWVRDHNCGYLRLVAHKRKEGRWSEPLSSTVYDCSTVFCICVCRRGQLTTSSPGLTKAVSGKQK